uniref:Uncharacterized protein n=1 Tax=Fundulus heteroclitus TaxID=8078 RepID=A0A3Q2QJN5_FUNHE
MVQILHFSLMISKFPSKLPIRTGYRTLCDIWIRWWRRFCAARCFRTGSPPSETLYVVPGRDNKRLLSINLHLEPEAGSGSGPAPGSGSGPAPGSGSGPAPGSGSGSGPAPGSGSGPAPGSGSGSRFWFRPAAELPVYFNPPSVGCSGLFGPFRRSSHRPGQNFSHSSSS